MIRYNVASTFVSFYLIVFVVYLNVFKYFKYMYLNVCIYMYGVFKYMYLNFFLLNYLFYLLVSCA